MVEGYPVGLPGWGAPAIFKEGGRLLCKYFRLLNPFILAFFVPAVLIISLQMLGNAWIISHHVHHPHHHFLGRFAHHHHHHFGFEGLYPPSRKESEAPSFGVYAPAPCPGPHHHPHILPLIINDVGEVLVWLFISLAIAAMYKVVAYIYSNNEEDPSVTKSIYQSLPGALFRLFITTLWGMLITIVIVFVVSLPFQLLMLIFKSRLNPRIIGILNMVLVSIARLILGVIFLLVEEVSVLEPSNYGLAALKKSSKLVQAKLPTAVIVFLADTIIKGLLAKLTEFAIFFPTTGKLPFWTVYIFAVLLALLYLVFFVYFVMVDVVLYFSCKLKFDADEQYLPVQSGEDNPYTPLVVPAED